LGGSAVPAPPPDARAPCAALDQLSRRHSPGNVLHEFARGGVLANLPAMISEAGEGVEGPSSNGRPANGAGDGPIGSGREVLLQVGVPVWRLEQWQELLIALLHSMLHSFNLVTLHCRCCAEVPAHCPGFSVELMGASPLLLVARHYKRFIAVLQPCCACGQRPARQSTPCFPLLLGCTQPCTETPSGDSAFCVCMRQVKACGAECMPLSKARLISSQRRHSVSVTDS